MNNKKKTILLVEDNESDVELAKRALLKAETEVEIVVARNGQQALDYMFGMGEYDDLQLPQINGIETLRRLRSDPRTFRQIVVVLTSSLEKTDLLACYELGVNSYIRKPVDFAIFAETLKCLNQYWLLINEPPPSI
jgi:CheY-like chemotaxis protein